ncbi:3-methyl-2-oxobutanoate hydroxymethyltransferase [Caldichromatium japonicum]|uniref:3-methyl-2-oxobutanoate hydroxymethyltransferase n=1 Tax=Caldichromatium japonicum TaxID=2699430 RepID=A0A6G7VG69_9GAMM|nr:3-methyl-2-oxobutanoate hydroxymethyltransferase [Caldichromatium japonicum]QIK38984.1 3-methyl-2-oxobutanoate hydroxymethyltransferase [Caldichromatium japonicum]
MSAAPITIASLSVMKSRGERIACLTCYDASFAHLLDRVGVDVLLVGDSLGMVIQGHATTLPVTLEQMIYHSAAVARGRKRALLVADLPFMTYATPEQAIASAARLMQEGGAEVIKLEGGAPMVETVRRMSELGIPVCAHLGLLPQSVNRLGGYRFQGRDPDSAERIRQEAQAMEEAGAVLMVLECVPAALARTISESLKIPVIGIGAGPDCDGQVLVLYDMLGLHPGKPPRFSRDFMAGGGEIGEAVAAYVAAVRTGQFPSPAETPY